MKDKAGFLARTDADIKGILRGPLGQLFRRHQRSHATDAVSLICLTLISAKILCDDDDYSSWLQVKAPLTFEFILTTGEYFQSARILIKQVNMKLLYGGKIKHRKNCECCPLCPVSQWLCDNCHPDICHPLFCDICHLSLIHIWRCRRRG